MLLGLHEEAIFKQIRAQILINPGWFWSGVGCQVDAASAMPQLTARRYVWRAGTAFCSHIGAVPYSIMHVGNTKGNSLRGSAVIKVENMLSARKKPFCLQQLKATRYNKSE